MDEPLPWARTEVVGGLLVRTVEAVDYRDHRKDPEGQGPGQLRAECGGEEARLQAKRLEAQSDAEADEQARPHPAGDGEGEQQSRSGKAPPECEGGCNRDCRR